MNLGRFLIAVLVLSFAARSATGITTGLTADYFLDDRFEGTPAFTRVDTRLDTRRLESHWAGAPPARFSVRWQGYVTVREGGTYSFRTRSDDGSRVTVGDALVVDNSGEHAPVEKIGDTALTAGTHRVLIEYEQRSGGYDFEFGSSVPEWRFTTQRPPEWRLRAAHALDVVWIGALVSAIAWALWLLPLHAGAIGAGIALQPRLASFLFFALLAIVETWPLARHPAVLSRNDNNDTVLNEWVLAWVAHQAPRSPLTVFDANIFHPERDTLAYSESMPVQSAMAAPLLWLGASPVLAYNLVLMAGLALSGWAMCIVIAQWTGQWGAGLVSGVLAAFNAYTLTNLPHLQSLHVEFLPLALLALDRLLREPRARHALQLAAWFVLQSLTSIYLLVFSAVALACGALVRLLPLPPVRPIRPKRGDLVIALLLAAVAAAVALLPYLLPYWRIHHVQGFSRTLDWQARLSATWQDYLTTPGRIHYATWGNGLFANYGLFPGVVAMTLTGVAIARGVAWSDPRARMCLAIGAAGVLLSFGPSVPGYTSVYAILPPLRAIRAVGRFGFLWLFAVAALAGFGLAGLQRFVPSGRRRAIAAAAIAAAAIEPLSAPLELVRAERVSPIYSRIAGEAGAVVAELPFFGGGSAHAHAAYMLNSTAHWKPMLNGYSGVEPQSFVDNVRALGGFPDGASIDALRRARVTHVFVNTAFYEPSAIQSIDQDPALRRIDTLDGIILYEVR